MENILTDENFEKEINSTDKFVLVDFFATWCEPCSMLAPTLEKVAEYFSDKINIENRPLEVNLFSASEYSFMIPLFGFKKYRKFQIRNSWIRDFKPNYGISEVRNFGIVSDNHFSKALRKCGEKLFGFDFIENFLRKIEMEKILIPATLA